MNVPKLDATIEDTWAKGAGGGVELNREQILATAVGVAWQRVRTLWQDDREQVFATGERETGVSCPL